MKTLRAVAMLVLVSGALVTSGPASRAAVEGQCSASLTDISLPYLGPQASISDVDLASARRGWAVGGGNTGGFILRWNSSAWSRSTLPSISSAAGLHELQVVAEGRVGPVGLVRT